MKTKINCVLFLVFLLSIVGSGFGEIFIGNADFEDEPLNEGDYTYDILPWLYDYYDATGDWPAWISNGWYAWEPDPKTQVMFTCDTIVYQTLSSTYEEDGIYIYSADVALHTDDDDWGMYLYDATAGNHKTPIVSRFSSDAGEEPITVYSQWFNKSITFIASASEAEHQIGVAITGGWDTMFDNLVLTPPAGACLPDPYEGEKNVLINKTLLWHTGRDPNHPSLPNLAITDHEVYMAKGSPTDPNVPELNYVTTIAATGGDTAQYKPVDDMDRETAYYWRVDELMELGPNTITITGDIWKFETVGTTPVIEESTPADILVDAGDDAVFTVVAFNPYTSSGDDLSYQWYKVGTPDEELSDGADYSGSQTASLTVLDAQVADDDEGWYYCVATNTVGEANSNTSRSAKLSIKRMIAHWPFEGNADDATGNGNDGTLVGTPGFAAGLIGQAMEFDGVDDYVDLPDGFDYFAMGMTFSVWAKPTELTNWARFFDFGNGDGQDNILLARIGTSDRVGFHIYEGDDNNAFEVDDVIAPKEWQMLTVTVDDQGNASVYKNGTLLDAGTLAVPLVVTRVNNFIGRSNWERDDLYIGLMDDIRLYNYALEPLEVADMYLEVKPDDSVCLSYPELDISGPDGEPDCAVDILDFALMASQWAQCNIVPDCL
jgi:hypothetical protein